MPEEASKEVRNHESEGEGVHERTDSEDATHRRITSKTPEPTQGRQDGDGSGMPLKL
jgi:hypothetical protein